MGGQDGYSRDMLNYTSESNTLMAGVKYGKKDKMELGLDLSWMQAEAGLAPFDLSADDYVATHPPMSYDFSTSPTPTRTWTAPGSTPTCGRSSGSSPISGCACGITTLTTRTTRLTSTTRRAPTSTVPRPWAGPSRILHPHQAPPSGGAFLCLMLDVGCWVLEVGCQQTMILACGKSEGHVNQISKIKHPISGSGHAEQAEPRVCRIDPLPSQSGPATLFDTDFWPLSNLARALLYEGATGTTPTQGGHHENLELPLILAVAVVAVVASRAPADAQRRASAQVGANCAGGFQALFDEIETVPLSAAEDAEVLYLREEEKLARDVYLTLAESWQLPIFSNIAPPSSSTWIWCSDSSKSTD